MRSRECSLVEGRKRTHPLAVLIGYFSRNESSDCNCAKTIRREIPVDRECTQDRRAAFDNADSQGQLLDGLRSGRISLGRSHVYEGCGCLAGEQGGCECEMLRLRS